MVYFKCYQFMKVWAIISLVQSVSNMYMYVCPLQCFLFLLMSQKTFFQPFVEDWALYEKSQHVYFSFFLLQNLVRKNLKSRFYSKCQCDAGHRSGSRPGPHACRHGMTASCTCDWRQRPGPRAQTKPKYRYYAGHSDRSRDHCSLVIRKSFATLVIDHDMLCS